MLHFGGSGGIKELRNPLVASMLHNIFQDILRSALKMVPGFAARVTSMTVLKLCGVEEHTNNYHFVNQNLS